MTGTSTFGDLLAAVEAAPGLTPGVRSNLRGVVIRAARELSGAGLDAAVDVPRLNRWILRATAARLGFRSKGSLAAFISNLRRALVLAGVDILPGRDRTPLRPSWAALADRIPDDPARRALSRFLRFASSAGWEPEEIGPAHLERFRHELREKALRSKADKLTRLVVSHWRRLQTLVPAWPQGDIRPQQRSDRLYALPWSDFPESLRQDAEAFVSRGDEDWLRDDDARRPLRPATRASYRDALRRMASLLVMSGLPADELRTLADLVRPDRVYTILHLLGRRLGRTRGGSVGYMAALALAVGTHWCRFEGRSLEKLQKYWDRTRPPQAVMSECTRKRLGQFDDPAAIDALVALPDILAAKAKRHGSVDVHSAKLVRVALYLRLATDTAMRSGNVVQLDLDRHFIGLGTKGPVHIEVPGGEVKNCVDLQSPLRPETVRLLRRYVEQYRRIHCPEPTPWLFPRGDGSAWTAAQVYGDVVDLTAQHLGLDVTPHLLRSVAGKIVLDRHPDAYPVVQQLLGHKSMATTLAFYAPIRPAKARSRYHELLEGRSGKRRAG